MEVDFLFRGAGRVAGAAKPGVDNHFSPFEVDICQTIEGHKCSMHIIEGGDA